MLLREDAESVSTGPWRMRAMQRGGQSPKVGRYAALDLQKSLKPRNTLYTLPTEPQLDLSRLSRMPWRLLPLHLPGEEALALPPDGAPRVRLRFFGLLFPLRQSTAIRKS